MKKLVWLFGVLMLLSFVVPTDDLLKLRPVKPVAPVVPVVPGVVDAQLVSILAPATAEDRANVAGIYTGLQTVINRDKGELVDNTEKFAVLQANTLKLAVEQVGRYPGLDKAIEAVFLSAIGNDDVNVITPEVADKLSKACSVIIDSARAAK